MTTPHTGDLDHDLADAIRTTHSSYIEIDAIAKVDGEPVTYEVLFTHRYKVDATTAVAALSAARAFLLTAMGGVTS